MRNKNWIKTTSLSLLYLATTSALANDNLWQHVQSKPALTQIEAANVNASNYQLVKTDIDLISKRLLQQDKTTHTLDLPMPDGTNATFVLTYSPVYEKALADKYPSIRTFTGYQLNNPENNGRFDITPHGFHGMFFYNKERVYIDPVSRGDNKTYISYYKKDAQPRNAAMRESVLASRFLPSTRSHVENSTQAAANGTLRTYRIAISAAAEYTAFHGGTKELAQAAIITALNRINEVYNRDLAVQLNLVAKNDTVVYTDAATDPFDNSDNDLDTNLTVINDNIGIANFDVGHIFNTAGGGVAYLGVVCHDELKAGGLTGDPTPTNDPFVIDYVAHEIGHQFGAEHSFNGTEGACGNRSPISAFEPGSGSTIMAYAGICGGQNLQRNSDAFFHSHSLDQMNNYLDQFGSCAVETSLNNQQPTVNAGADYNIPGNTPFVLTGSATDPDNDTMSYSWEQFDTGTSSSSRETMVDNGNRPLFRAWLPTAEPVRYFPRLPDVLANTTTIGETYSNTDRILNFRLVVRDGQGNVTNDAMQVFVDRDAGPFAITSPTSADTWEHGNTPEVTWDVARTNLAPVNCANVDIMLSTDGGNSFDTTLIAGTANDGSATIDIPTLESETARLKIQCSDNVFFAVNTGGNFKIDGIGDGTIAPEITGQTSLSLDEDSSLAITLDNLTVDDADSTFPGDFTLTLEAGSNYTLSGNTITPSANFNGELTVPARVNDGTNNSNVFNLSVTVNPVNDAPVLSGPEALSTDEDTALTITDETLNITDPDNASGDMTITITEGENYTLDGTTITPAENFNGELALSVTVNDGELDSNTQAITLTVNAVNDAPTAGNDTASVVEDSAATNINLLGNDSDIDGDTLTITGTSYSGTGTVTTTATGVTYTPGRGFTGNDSFSYTISDGNGGTATGSVSVTVTQKPSSGGGSIPLSALVFALPLVLLRRLAAKR